MFYQMKSDNKTTTCCFRLLGWLIMYIGIVCLFSPIIAVFKWIPLVGWLIAHLLSVVVYIFAFIVSLCLTLITIALAWLWYRPLYGLCLLLVVSLMIGAMFLTKKQ